MKTKILGLTGWQYHRKLIEEGQLPNPTNINRQNKERWAENAGYNNFKEYRNKYGIQR